MIYVEPSALKHGLTANEVRFAWLSVFEFKIRVGSGFPPHYLALGVLPNGKTCELIAVSDGANWHVFHAMAPPTKGFMHEYNGGRK